MDSQRSLFDEQQVPVYAMARRDDPVTSHEAAAQHVSIGSAERNRRLCLAVVRQHPAKTAAEIAELAGIDRYEASRRLPELRSADLVENSAYVKCSVTGNSSMTWMKI